MEQNKINRINQLAKKSKLQPLSEDEKKEQKSLRDEYISEWRQNVKASLDNTYIMYPDGRKEKIGKNKKDS